LQVFEALEVAVPRALEEGDLVLVGPADGLFLGFAVLLDSSQLALAEEGAGPGDLLVDVGGLAVAAGLEAAVLVGLEGGAG
jgi:hypothetical protein